MGVFKTNDERLDGVVEFVSTYFPNALPLVQQRIDSLGTQRTAIASALSLGSRSGGNSAAETERRNGIRAVLFLLFTDGKQPVALANTFVAKYSAMTLQQLQNEIKGRLPVLDSSPIRDSWDPRHFTQVLPRPLLQNTPNRFRYLVFGMMNTYTGRGVSYETILANPQMLKSFMLSTSIIDETHIPTYYPYGLILRAPKENIASTSRKDQGFKNYKMDDPANPMSPIVKNDMLDEVRRVAGQHQLRTPDAILQETKANGDTGYNEIVVLGTGPTNTEIQIQGFFMKVDSGYERYVRPDNSLMGRKNESAFVTDDILAKMKATGLPIVRIVDTSGKGK
jgi:hypothetical protein